MMDATAALLRHRGKIIAAGIVIIVGVLALALAAVAALMALMTSGSDDSKHKQALANCAAPGDPLDAGPPATGSAKHQQTVNAKKIAKTVTQVGLSGRATLVALTAAVGESDLINIGHGDAAGPDSRGLFQQRSGWGSKKQRMNPVWATKSFLLGPEHDGKDHGPGGRGLAAVAGWQGLSVPAAIHAVQRNSDPNHYAQYVPRARTIANRAGIDLDTRGSSPSATPDAKTANPDEKTAALSNDCGAPAGGGDSKHDSKIGRIGDGTCPLDSKHAKDKTNPRDCNKALTFMAKQMKSGSSKWGRLCLALVVKAYGWNAAGTRTARQGAQDVIDAGMMSKKTKDIPAGAVMWWDGSQVGNPAGHVAIYDGHGHIYSNDVVTTGEVDRVSWKFPEKSWGQKWLGWSPPYFPNAV